MPQRRAAGMALIAVLWIVAALSIMVTGLTATVRQHIQVVGTQRDQATGLALGEAAVALVLQQMQAKANERVEGLTTVQVEYAGVPMDVEVAPLDGLISLNGADAALFAALLQTTGGLASGQAQALADELVAWRDARSDGDGAATQQPRRFEAPEDLLLVPGMDYALYARIAPLVSADLAGVSRVNPAAAPPEVLAVLAQGHEGRVAQYVDQRGSGQPGADTTGFNQAFVGTSGANLYRLQVKVPLDAGKILRLTRDVAVGSIYSRTAPWRVLRTDRQIVALSG
ncbi:general secretion pathway protein GspK [Ottowia sp.]|uniref:general secretion pathway protein GspK n=1 Tax=Ottowia sp. TaxID=1898956 RepID=UPI003A863F18